MMLEEHGMNTYIFRNMHVHKIKIWREKYVFSTLVDELRTSTEKDEKKWLEID